MRLPFQLFCSAGISGASHSSLDFQTLQNSRALNSSGTQVALNAANGNAFVKDKEFKIEDDGFVLSVGMVWNSSDEEWRFTAAARITNFSANIITLIEADGRSVDYIKQGNNYICAKPAKDGLSQITANADGSYQRFSPLTGIKEKFNANGVLTSKLLATGKVVTYEFDDKDQVTITLPSKRVLSLTCDPQNTQQKNLIINGTTLASYIENNGSLTTRITNPDSSVYDTTYTLSQNALQISSSDNTQSTIKYNNQGAVTSLMEGGRLWNVTQDLANKSFAIGVGNNNFKIGYDVNNNLASFQAPADIAATTFQCDSNGQLRIIIDADGKTHKINYDVATGLANNFIEDTQSLSYVYDTNGLKLSETKQDGYSSATKYYVYNAKRQPIYEISAAGRVTRFSYNTDNRLQTKQILTTQRLPANINLTDIDNWWNALTALDLQLLQTTSYDYDQYGRENQVVNYTGANDKGIGINSNSDNAIITKELDTLGQITSSSVANNSFNNQPIFSTTTKKYDSLNRILQTNAAVGTNVARTTNYTYNNNLTTITHANSLIEKLTHDSGCLTITDDKGGRLHQNTRNPDGSIKTISRTDGLNETHLTDASGRLQYKILADGEVTKYCYDVRGKLTTKVIYDANADPALSKYELFNQQGQLCFEVIVKRINGQMRGVLTKHEYLLGNKIGTTQYATALTANDITKVSYDYLASLSIPSDPADRKNKYYYDADDFLIGEQVLVEGTADANAFTTYYERDGAGNITREVIYTDKVAFGTFNIATLETLNKLETKNVYDGAGRKIKTTDADGYCTIYTYYPNGKLQDEKRFYQKGVVSGNDPNNEIICYDYDALGRRILISNKLTKLDITIGYDINGNETSRTLIDNKTGQKRVMQKSYNLYDEVTGVANERVSAANATWAANTIDPITGLTLSKTDEYGRVTYYFYDLCRRPEYVITPDGACTKYTYDFVSGKPAEIYCFYDKQPGMINTLATVQRNGYTDANILNKYTKNVFGKDRVTTRQYDGSGILTKQIDPNGQTHTYNTNIFDEINLETHTLDNQQTLTISRQFDLRGNDIVTIKDPNGLQITTQQKFDDALNRKTQTISELNLTTHIEFTGLRAHTITDSEGRTKTITQDAKKRTSTETDWSGSNTVNHIYHDQAGTHTIQSATVDRTRDIIETKNAFGEMIAKQVNGRTTTISKDVDGQTNGITYADGATELTNYNLQGLVELKIDSNNKQTVLKYDEVNHLKSRVEVTKTTTYSANQFGENETIVQPNNLIIQNNYQQAGLIQTSNKGPQALNLRESQINNYAGGLTQINQANGAYVENIKRDVLNRETNRSIEMEDNTQLTVKDLTLDAAGNTVIEKDGLGNSIYKIFDTRGNLLYRIDQEGFVIQKTYDVNNKEISERCYALKIDTTIQPTLANIKPIPSYQDSLRQKVYDEDGLLKYEVILLEANANTNQSRIIEYRYNGNKEKIKTIAYAIPVNNCDLTKVADCIQPHSKDRTTDIARNLRGRRALRRDALGYLIEKKYDPKGNVIARIHYATQQSNLDFSQTAETLSPFIQKDAANDRGYYYVYDIYGNLRYEIDGEGFVLEHQYNANNKPTDDYRYYTALSASDFANLLPSLQNPDRNNNDLLNAIASAIKVDPRDVHEVAAYDIADRLTSKTDGAQQTESYKLNELGLIEEKTDKYKGIWHHQYDAAKRLKTETSPLANLTRIDKDASGKLIPTVLNQNRISSTDYDANSNPTVSTVTGSADLAGQARTITRLYNKKNQFIGTRIESVKLDVPTIANGTLTPASRPEISTTVTTTKIVDFAGREIVNIDERGVSTFTVYDANGRKRFIVDGEANVTEFKYDDAFREHTRIIRHDTKLSSPFIAANASGIALADLQNQYPETIDNDRTITITRNNLGQKIKVEKDAITTALIDEEGNATAAIGVPTREFTYNAFNQVTRQEDLIDTLGNKAVTQYFYDRNGCMTKTISPKGYITTRTFGPKKLELTRTEDNVTYEKVYDSRLMLIDERQYDSQAYFNAVMQNGIPSLVPAADNIISNQTQYDAAGNIIAYINANGEIRYVIRNQLGDVVRETEFPSQLSIDDQNVIPIVDHYINVHGEAVGALHYATPATINNGNLTVLSSAADQLTLLDKDNRGCTLAIQYPSGFTKNFTYNEQKKLARSYYWVTGATLTNQGPQFLPTLRATQQLYNNKQKLAQINRWDGNEDISTFYQYNSFDERIGEGPSADQMLLTNIYDKSGNCWYNNKDQAIPTITFHNLAGDEKAHFRAINNDTDFVQLYSINRNRAITDLLQTPYDKTYKSIQRTSLQHDLEHNPTTQFLPWYRQQKKGTPRVTQITFTVQDNPFGLQGRYIIWPAPASELLTGKFKLRIKGTQDWQVFEETCIPGTASHPEARAICISGLTSGEYEYELDQYFQNPNTGNLEQNPTFCALGDVMLDTGVYPNDQCIWHMRDEKTLILAGKTDNVFGIELIQNGIAIKRLCGIKNPDSTITFDLSNEISGDYDFNIVTEINVSNTLPISIYHPSFKFNTATSVVPTGLPPEILDCNKQIPLQANGMETIEILEMPDSKFPGGRVTNSLPIYCALVYGRDKDNNQIFLNNVIPNLPTGFGYKGPSTQLPAVAGDPIVLVRSDTPINAIQIDGVNYPAQLWSGNAYRIFIDPARISSNTVNTLTLVNAPTTNKVGKLAIRTDKSSDQFTAREIQITNIDIQRYALGHERNGYFSDAAKESYLAHYQWQTNLGKDHHIIANINGKTQAIPDLSSSPANAVYTQQTLSMVGNNRPMGVLDLSVALPNGDIIEMNPNLNPIYNVSPGPMQVLAHNATETWGRKLIDQSQYLNTYALYLSPVPTNTVTVLVQYEDIEPNNKKIWRPIQCTYKPGQKGFTLPITGDMTAGAYSIKLQFLDAQQNILDTSSIGLTPEADNWSYTSIKLQRGMQGIMNFTSLSLDQTLETVKCKASATYDRYNNKTTETNRSGDTTSYERNLFKQITKIISPKETAVGATGEKTKGQLITENRYNKLAQLVATMAPRFANEQPAIQNLRIPNNAGKTLLNTDADDVIEKTIYDIFNRIISVVPPTGAPSQTSYSTQAGLSTEVHTDGKGNKETLTKNEENQVIKKTDKRQNDWYYNYNLLQQLILQINPSLKTIEKTYNNRTGLLERIKDQFGNRQYYNRTADPDDQHGVTVQPNAPTAVENYVGINVSHIDIAGQVYNYLRNPNKQLLGIKGAVSADVNAKRGVIDNNGTPPPAVDIDFNFDEAGHQTDIYDNSSNLTTHKQFNPEDCCEYCMFIGADGQVYQLTFTEFDKMQRVKEIRDTRIMMKIGYDKNSNKRYARAYIKGDNPPDQWMFRESWYDYTVGGRPIIRDGVLNQESGVIEINQNQGMQIQYQDGLAKIITQIKNNVTQHKVLSYDVLNLLESLYIKNDLAGPNLFQQNYKRDAATNVTETETKQTCTIIYAETQPAPTYYDVPTYILSVANNAWQLWYYNNNTTMQIAICDDEKLKNEFKKFTPEYPVNPLIQYKLNKAIQDYFKSKVGTWYKDQTLHDKDGNIAQQIHDEKTKGGSLHTDRTVFAQNLSIPTSEQTTTHGEIQEGDVTATYDQLETTNTKLAFGDTAIISSTSTDRKFTSTQNLSADQVAHKGDIQVANNANITPTEVRGDTQIQPNQESVSDIQLVVNSENCVVYKQNAAGRNYYFYVEKQPGKIVLMAYFGDLPNQLKLAIDTQKLPSTMVLDEQQYAINASWPPAAPSTYTTPRNMTYAEIAAELNYDGYAAAIAEANNANVETQVPAETQVTIPPLVIEIPDTAWNGTVPSVQNILGSLYPSLPTPTLKFQPPKLNFAEQFLEVAANVAIMACAPELLAGMLGTTLASLGSLETGILSGIAGGISNALTQTLNIQFGTETKFDYKQLAANFLNATIQAGVLKDLNTKLGIDFQKMTTPELGVVFNNVITAETIALAQQVSLIASGIQKKIDWEGLETAALDAVVGSEDIFNSNDVTGRVADTGAQAFIDGITDTKIAGQKEEWSTIAANTTGAMVGTYVGSSTTIDMQGDHLAAVAAERRGNEFAIADMGVAGKAGVGGTPAGKAVPKPTYATKADADSDVVAGKAAVDGAAVAAKGYSPMLFGGKATNNNTKMADKATQNDNLAAKSSTMATLKEIFDLKNGDLAANFRSTPLESEILDSVAHSWLIDKIDEGDAMAAAGEWYGATGDRTNTKMPQNLWDKVNVVAGTGIGLTCNLASRGFFALAKVGEGVGQRLNLNNENLQDPAGISISASTPSEIAWGYGNISSRQIKILTSLSEPGDFLQLHKSDINVTDLAALTAHTGDEFALFTLGSRRIIIRGSKFGLNVDEDLTNKLFSEDWRWSAHTHPGTSDKVLMASGFPGDRATLNLFNQTRSLILNSVGRRSIFDRTNDFGISNKFNNSITIKPGF